MKKTYKLNALQDFICIAGDCSYSCCKRGWDIFVDANTYDKWNALDEKHPARNNLFDSAEEMQVSGQTRIVMKKTSGRGCNQLSEDGLCNIQKNHGVELMPQVCIDYPRRQYKKNNVTIFTATLSCPEIVRLALLSDKKPVYDVKGSLPKPIRKKISESTIAWYLEKLTTAVIADEKYELNLVLAYIARALGEVSGLETNGQLNTDTLESLSLDYSHHLDSLKSTVVNGELTTNPATARYMWHVIVSILKFRSDLLDEFGLDCNIDELLQLYGQSEGGTIDTDPFWGAIQDYKNQAREAQKNYADALRRYLVFTMISKSLAWRKGVRESIEAFLECVIPFASAQLVMWLITAKQQTLTEEDFIAVIARIETLFMHHFNIAGTMKKNNDLYKLELYYDWFLDIG